MSVYCIPSLRRTLPSGSRFWYFHFARTSHPQHNWAVKERIQFALRRSSAVECCPSELVHFSLGLLVRERSVEVDIGVIHRIVLQSILLVRRCLISVETRFATPHRPLQITCSQPLSLHVCSGYLCRDGGAKGRYFERADRGAGLTRPPIFGASSSARLAASRF
jgi:hypothetical protein